MRRVFLISFVAVVSCLILFASLSQAKGVRDRGHDGGPRPEMSYAMLKNVAEKIGVSDEQLESIKNIFLSSEKAMIKLRADKQIIELDLRDEMENAQPDRKKIIQFSDKINELEGKLHQTQLLRMVDIKNILTPEQIEKLEQLRRERPVRDRGGDNQRFQRMRDRYREVAPMRPDPPDREGGPDNPEEDSTF